MRGEERSAQVGNCSQNVESEKVNSLFHGRCDSSRNEECESVLGVKVRITSTNSNPTFL